MNRRPSESTLRIDHEDIQKVLSRAADVLSLVDDRGRLLKVNHQACRTLGYSLAEMSELSIFDLDRELDRPQFEDLRRRVESEEVITSERRFRCKDGSTLDVEVRMKNVLFSGVRARLFLIAARDITERKHLQERLVDALVRAEESSRMKQLFLSNLSHEIRTPLHVIVGYTSLISSFIHEGGEVDVASVLESMERATHRLLNTIHSTLDLSKIEKGGLRPRPEVLDVVAVVTTEVQSLRNDAARKGITVSCELGDSPRQVRFDSYCLSNAVRKLLDNAVKFTQQGEIGVAIEDDGKGGFVLEVRDTGAGISSAYLPNLFEPFTQEDPGLTRRFEGVGIGLALAKRFVELNGATLSAASEKGKGSLFRIHFPKGIVVVEGAAASRRKRSSGSPLRLAAAS
jgi:PAS domain S-box-containing protein